MVRVLILAALICVCGILSSSMAEARPDERVAPTAATTSIPKSTTITEKVVSTKEKDEVQKPRVLDEQNKRYSDGNYEYRYALSNGITRYEKSYWTSAPDGKQVQAHKGFFSHPLPNNQYLTVFYTADATGYHQDSSTFTKNAPLLPKHLEIPESDFPIETTSSATRPTTAATTTRKTTTTTTTTRKPRRTTTRKPTTTTTRKPTTTTTTTTRKPTTTTTRKPRTTTKKSLKKPSNFNWIY